MDWGLTGEDGAAGSSFSLTEGTDDLWGSVSVSRSGSAGVTLELFGFGWGIVFLTAFSMLFDGYLLVGCSSFACYLVAGLYLTGG